MLNELIKIANKLDEAGLTNEADQLDAIMKIVAQEESTGFSDEDGKDLMSWLSNPRFALGEARQTGHTRPISYGYGFTFGFYVPENASQDYLNDMNAQWDPQYFDPKERLRRLLEGYSSSSGKPELMSAITSIEFNKDGPHGDGYPVIEFTIKFDSPAEQTYGVLPEDEKPSNEIIDKFSQDMMFEQDQIRFRLDGIKKSLLNQVNDKMLMLDSVLDAAPEGKEQAFLSAHLQANPITISYPSK